VAEAEPGIARLPRWSAAQALAYVIVGTPLKWKEWFPRAGILGPQIKRAGEKLGEAIGNGQVEAWGRPNSPDEEMEPIPSSDFRPRGFVWMVQPDGDMATWPPGRLATYRGRRWYAIEFDPEGIKQAVSVPLTLSTEWLNEETGRLAAAGVMLIPLDETGRGDWARYVTLVMLLGCNPETLPLEVSELHAMLHEAQEIRRCGVNRVAEAARANQLEVKGRKVSDWEVVKRIPASLVTADVIWSLLRSGEMTIGGQRYVDGQIGPPESPEATLGPSNQTRGKKPKRKEVAETESTRWQRDRTIAAIKTIYPPDGIRPEGVSIAALTNRINRLPGFKDLKVSEDTVGRADIELKTALGK
jgi:hypothetical protein